jgi:hypothetical protein
LMRPPTNEVRVALAGQKPPSVTGWASMPAGATSRYALGAGGVGAARPTPAASLISVSRYGLPLGGCWANSGRTQLVNDSCTSASAEALAHFEFVTIFALHPTTGVGPGYGG